MKSAFLLLLSGSAAALPVSTQTSETAAHRQIGELERTPSVVGARDATADARAFVEVATPRPTYFAGEVFSVQLRFGLDAHFSATSLIQPFRRHLDVPAQVVAPWLRELSGAIALAERSGPPPGDRERVSFALDDEIGTAVRIDDRVVDGRTFMVFEIERRFLPLSAGELAVPAPLLRFAYATRFEEDFVHGRVAIDRHDVFVRGEPLVLTIEPLPEMGRPREFTGAVGRFLVHAEVKQQDPVTGASLALVLRIEGDGNLAYFEPPRLFELAGFHVLGTIDENSATQRTITYDLAPPEEQVSGVPSIAFAYFDPSPPGGYRIVRTDPVPLRTRAVLALGNEAAQPDAGAALARTHTEKRPAGATRDPSLAGTIVAVLAVIAAIVFLVFRLRARARAQARPDGVRAPDARTTFDARAGRGDSDLADAFAEFLALHLRCSTAAVNAPDLSARLVAAGVSPALAGRAAALLERLVAARYGGSLPVDARSTVHGLVDALEDAFRSSQEAHEAR